MAYVSFTTPFCRYSTNSESAMDPVTLSLTSKVHY